MARPKIDQLIGSLQEVINGPEGQKDQSIRGQLEIIVGNLMASSDSIRKLADVQGKEQGSIGEVLRVFEETAKRLSEDAEMAQKLIGKMGHTSDAVTQASEQVKNLALISAQAGAGVPQPALSLSHNDQKTAARAQVAARKFDAFYGVRVGNPAFLDKIIWKRISRGKNWLIDV